MIGGADRGIWTCAMQARKTARLIVLSPEQEVLLVRYEGLQPPDPLRPEILSYWVTPGGGVRDSEDYGEAAMRELREETGVELSSVGPWVWKRKLILEHEGLLKEQHERYFLCWATAEAPLENHTDEPIREIRWWSLDELRSANEVFFPSGFVDLVAPLLSGQLPTQPRALR